MNILIYPNEILQSQARSVEKIDGELQQFIDDMIIHMYRAKGIGLAANQVGELKQLFIMDCEQEDRGHRPIVIINPRITSSEGSETGDEGCLSVPDYTAAVKRASMVEVKGYDRNGKEITIEEQGLAARCIQHEIDHLNGICFVDRLGPVKRTLFKKKWGKILAEIKARQESAD